MLAGAPGVALARRDRRRRRGVFASQHDLMMLYADARSHLTIARRLIDGPNHGIVQLGTVWLPFPHIVLIPFVASQWLWHTGGAAVPVDIACLVIEALSIFSLVRTHHPDPLGVVDRGRAPPDNPSVLYLHTTALTEPVLFAALLGTVGDARQVDRAARSRTPAARSRSTAVFPAAVAVLSRYDGWAFVAAATRVRARRRAVRAGTSGGTPSTSPAASRLSR